MQKPSAFTSVELRTALCFIILSGAWVWITNLFFYGHDFVSDMILVCLITVLIFFLVKLSRKRLMRMTGEYKSLFEEHPSPMWIFDTATLRFLAVNEAAVKQYGYSKTEFLRMTVLDIRPVADIPAVQQYVADPTPRKGDETVWKHISKKGKEIMVKAISYDVTFNRRKAKLVEANDITDMLRQQEKMREMSLIAENTTNGIVLSDGQGRIKWVNKAFEQLTGYHLHEIMGKFPPDFLHGPLTDKQMDLAMHTLALEKKAFTGDLVNYKKDGSPYWVHLNLSPIIIAGEVENIVVIQTDITELKRQSEKISEQYCRLKEITFITSHDARSQLTNILSLCEIIGDNHPDPEQRELIGYLKESAAKLDQVIHTIVNQAGSLMGGKEAGQDRRLV